MPSINNFIQGFSDGLPGMKDFRHASRLYIDDQHKLAPKHKFLFHVVFDIDDTVAVQKFTEAERLELNMLVKSVTLPSYNFDVEEKVQYNKKMYVSKALRYEPVSITFHDDHANTVNAFWKKYYEYNVADPVILNSRLQQDVKDDYYQVNRSITKWGLDTPKKRKKPFIRTIQIFALHKQRFTSFTLVNPVIGSFAHDELDQTDGTGIMANTMQILYETVRYNSGLVKSAEGPSGFANLHYDNEPSPLTVLGGGTNSLFGPGGVVDGIGSVIGDISRGQVNLGTILKGINTYNNAKKIKKRDVKEELKGIVKEGVLEVGKQAGSITNPVGAFSVGAVVAAGAVLATAKGSTDDNTNTVSSLKNPTPDTVNFLTADESFNLIESKTTVKDEIAASLYYKDIGSRKNLSVAESNIEFEGSNTTVKSVYRAKANTNIRKLVTEGYIKINRTTQDVSLANEKASL